MACRKEGGPSGSEKNWCYLLPDKTTAESVKNRGVQDIFIACVDGLSGFPEALESIFPQTEVQLCIVHMVRNGLHYVSWQERKDVAADLKQVYQAATTEEAEARLEEFAEAWDEKYPTISRAWRQQRDQLTPFFAYPPEIRKVIYTTNAIESINNSIRSLVKNRRVFPNDEAATKLLYLALQKIAKKWSKPIKDWKAALNQFAIRFEEKVS